MKSWPSPSTASAGEGVPRSGGGEGAAPGEPATPGTSPGVASPSAATMDARTSPGRNATSSLKNRNTIRPLSRNQASRTLSDRCFSDSLWTDPSTSTTARCDMQAKSTTQPPMWGCLRNLNSRKRRPRNRFHIAISAGVCTCRKCRRNSVPRALVRCPGIPSPPAASRPPPLPLKR